MECNIQVKNCTFHVKYRGCDLAASLRLLVSQLQWTDTRFIKLCVSKERGSRSLACGFSCALRSFGRLHQAFGNVGII